MSTFNLPELGEGLEEGEIVGWKVKEGDSIKADEAMVEVMTDKATIEVPAPVAGKVSKLYYKVGDLAYVGKPLIDIEASGEASVSKKVEQAEKTDATAAETKKEATTGQSVSSPTASAAPAETYTSSSDALASPAVRRFARENGVKLSAVRGTGDRGRVLKKDVEGALQSPSSSGTAGGSLHALQKEERVPFVGIRRKIAESLSKSMYTAVHFTHNDEADFSEIMRLRKEANAYAEKNGLTRVTFLPFYIKAAIAAMRKFPILNSELDEKTNEVVIKHYYHFGISVQTDNGLMVAVIRDCDRKDIFQLAKDIKEIADRARAGSATREDLTGSTITITNPGNIGGLHASPVINFPETCILGMYQIKKRPVVKEIDGEDVIVARPMMYTNITCDHRIIDGAIAAEFMRTLCDYLENPARMAFF